MVKEGLHRIDFFVEGVSLVSVGCVGCVLNTMCIITFSKISVQKNFHRLMLSLALFDILYITTSIVLFGIPALYPSVYESSFYRRLMPIVLPLVHIGLTGSIYLTVAIALERYTTVCHPFFKLTHSWPAATYIIPICIFSLLYNIPKFLELEVNKGPLNLTFPNINISTLNGNQTDLIEGEQMEPTETMLNLTGNETELFPDLSEMERVVPSSLRLNPVYIQVYIVYLNLVVHGIIPLVLLVGLNICTYRQLRKYHNTLDLSACSGTIQLREVRLSQVSLVIVFVFILCHGVRWIPNIWELQQTGGGEKQIEWPTWIRFLTHLSHLLTVFNSSVNFFIYLVKHPSVFKRLYRREACNTNVGTDTTTLVASKKVSYSVPPNTVNIEMTDVGNVFL